MLDKFKNKVMIISKRDIFFITVPGFMVSGYVSFSGTIFQFFAEIDNISLLKFRTNIWVPDTKSLKLE